MSRSTPYVTLLGAMALGVACGGSASPGRTPSGGQVSCGSDGDCEVTTFAGCCACCPSEPHALPRHALHEQKDRCAVTECAACSDRVTCPKPADASRFTATCRDGTCAASASPAR